MVLYNQLFDISRTVFFDRICRNNLECRKIIDNTVANAVHASDSLLIFSTDFQVSSI